jgi:hypothetical protein
MLGTPQEFMSNLDSSSAPHLEAVKRTARRFATHVDPHLWRAPSSPHDNLELVTLGNGRACHL